MNESRAAVTSCEPEQLQRRTGGKGLVWTFCQWITFMCRVCIFQLRTRKVNKGQRFGPITDGETEGASRYRAADWPRRERNQTEWELQHFPLRKFHHFFKKQGAFEPQTERKCLWICCLASHAGIIPHPGRVELDLLSDKLDWSAAGPWQPEQKKKSGCVLCGDKNKHTSFMVAWRWLVCFLWVKGRTEKVGSTMQGNGGVYAVKRRRKPVQKK